MNKPLIISGKRCEKLKNGLPLWIVKPEENEYFSTFFRKKISKRLAELKIMRTFAPAIEKQTSVAKQDGPFVYRLGRKIFILERGVRFPHGLPTESFFTAM